MQAQIVRDDSLAVAKEMRDKSLNAGYQASLLCGNAACVAQTHLVVEPLAISDSRKGCGKARACRVPGCVETFDMCRHWPRCIPSGG